MQRVDCPIQVAEAVMEMIEIAAPRVTLAPTEAEMEEIEIATPRVTLAATLRQGQEQRELRR